MPNYEMNLTKNQMDLLVELYKPYETAIENDELVFKAIKNEVGLSFYADGRLVIEGDFKKEIKSINERLGIINFSAIGSNDSGSGDLFGPLVFCSVYMSSDDIEKYESFGLKDAKKMSDRKIIEIAPLLSKDLLHTVVILNPDKYNKLTRKGLNINRIRALLHNQVIVSTKEKIGKEIPAIIDQFCLPKIYFNYIKGESDIHNDVSFYNRAENIHIAVGAAYVIARFAYIAKLQQYSRFAGVKLLTGANEQVDRQLIYLYRSKGYNTLRPITKLDFRNLKENNIIPPQ